MERPHQHHEHLTSTNLLAKITEDDFWPAHICPGDRGEVVAFCMDSSVTCPEYEFADRMIAANGVTVWIHDAATVRTVDAPPVSFRASS